MPAHPTASFGSDIWFPCSACLRGVAIPFALGARFGPALQGEGWVGMVLVRSLHPFCQFGERWNSGLGAFSDSRPTSLCFFTRHPWRASHFLLLAQEKVTKRRAPRVGAQIKSAPFRLRHLPPRRGGRELLYRVGLGPPYKSSALALDCRGPPWARRGRGGQSPKGARQDAGPFAVGEQRQGTGSRLSPG